MSSEQLPGEALTPLPRPVPWAHSTPTLPALTFGHIWGTARASVTDSGTCLAMWTPVLPPQSLAQGLQAGPGWRIFTDLICG